MVCLLNGVTLVSAASSGHNKKMCPIKILQISNCSTPVTGLENSNYTFIKLSCIAFYSLFFSFCSAKKSKQPETERRHETEILQISTFYLYYQKGIFEKLITTSTECCMNPLRSHSSVRVCLQLCIQNKPEKML